MNSKESTDRLAEFIDQLYNCPGGTWCKWATVIVLSFFSTYVLIFGFGLNPQELKNIYSQTLSTVIQVIGTIFAIFGIFLVYLLEIKYEKRSTLLRRPIINAGIFVMGSIISLSLTDLIFKKAAFVGVFLLFFVVFASLWILISFIYMFVILPKRSEG